MAQYTVFYKDDAEKEIQQAYNGVCEDTDFIKFFTDLGCKNILVDSDDTPNTHYYVNDAEDGVVKRGTMSISVDKTLVNVDEVITLTGVPEGASVAINTTDIVKTMNSDSSLTLTLKQAGVFLISVTHPTARKYFIWNQYIEARSLAL
tara:strand:+ start:93 stop:536 length:444 start_codon:yes stop_codon:yes gene_type:complete